MRVSLAFCMAAGLLVNASAAQAEPPSLYEWLAVAPVIAEGVCLGTHGKYAHFQAEALLRGDGRAGAMIRVNLRRANRDRNRRMVKEALRFDTGRSYLLLLTTAAKSKKDAPPTFELVRGARGAREIPAEGRSALLAAVQRFIAMQDRNDDRATWREMGEMLEERDPLLIRTALDQFLKFRRGDARLLGRLRPLLDHPAPGMRERTALLIAQILEGRGAEPVADVELLQAELIAKARRDGAVEVRVAATQALERLDGVGIDEMLEEIARVDPDQRVRYAAERLLYERGRPRPAPEPVEASGARAWGGPD